MCRYAGPYKPHYACFKCRKTFKRRLMSDIVRGSRTVFEAKCPECGSLMASMGLDFESPKKNDIKTWTHMERLYSVGVTFHSCGCTGPGYIPNTKEKLIEYFENIICVYQSNLTFWRQRTEPTNDRELQREKSKYWKFLSKIPQTLWPKKGAIETDDAKKYWLDKIKQVEQKIESLQ